MSFLGAARELRALVAEVTDPSHPSWLVFCAGIAAMEAAARRQSAPGELYAAYLGANGGPRSDTFMAAARAPDADALRGAIAAARAAGALIEKLDGTLPDQPLRKRLVWRGGRLAREDLPEGPLQVAFATPVGVFLAGLDRTDEDIARDLANGRLPRVPSDAPTPAAIAVSLATEEIATARHLHRRAWTERGGPWLGIGHTTDLDLVTTCHLAIDGYGHGLFADAIFDLPPVRGGTSFGPAPPWADALPVGFAGRLLHDTIAFPRAAYAFGRALDRAYGGKGSFSPSFQIPLVPGDRSDPDRRKRRVLFGLLALRKDGGDFESYQAFRDRLSRVLPRETAAQGLLSRVLRATVDAPLPEPARRKLLVSSGLPSPLAPAVEVLAGRGQLSLIRLDAASRPIYAASSPGLFDEAGSAVLTLMPGPAGVTASICGTGRAGNAAGASALLDLFLAELRSQ